MLLQQPVEPGAVRRLARRVANQMAQQAPVQALPHLPVRVAEAVERLAAQVLLALDGQVAGLEQQRASVAMSSTSNVDSRSLPPTMSSRASELTRRSNSVSTRKVGVPDSNQ